MLHAPDTWPLTYVVMDIMRMIQREDAQAKAARCLGIVSKGVEAFDGEIAKYLRKYYLISRMRKAH